MSTENALRTCSKCAAENPSDAIFCAECGELLLSKEGVTDDAGKKSSKTIDVRVVGGIAAGIALVAVVVFAMLAGGIGERTIHPKVLKRVTHENTHAGGMEVTEYSYDSQGRLTSADVQGDDASDELFEYDEYGRLVRSWCPADKPGTTYTREERFEYDSEGRCTRFYKSGRNESFEGVEAKYAYDSHGRLNHAEIVYGVAVDNKIETKTRKETYSIDYKNDTSENGTAHVETRNLDSMAEGSNTDYEIHDGSIVRANEETENGNDGEQYEYDSAGNLLKCWDEYESYVYEYERIDVSGSGYVPNQRTNPREVEYWDYWKPPTLTAKETEAILSEAAIQDNTTDENNDATSINTRDDAVSPVYELEYDTEFAGCDVTGDGALDTIRVWMENLTPDKNQGASFAACVAVNGNIQQLDTEDIRFHDGENLQVGGSDVFGTANILNLSSGQVLLYISGRNSSIGTECPFLYQWDAKAGGFELLGQLLVEEEWQPIGIIKVNVEGETVELTYNTRASENETRKYLVNDGILTKTE